MKLTTTIIAVLVIAGVVLIVDHLRSTNTNASTLSRASTAPAQSTATQPVTTTPTQSSTGTASPSTGGYKDGTYSASSQYFVPHGSESITVNVTLKSGVVSDVSIQNSEYNGESAAYQQEFASMYKNYVVGKKINSLQLSVIAGASDTTQGFNDAVSQIASKAQA